MLLSADDFHEELEHTEYPDPAFQMPPEAQALIDQAGGAEQLIAMGLPIPQPEMLHDVKIKRIKSSGRLQAAAVPDEEFLIDSTAKALDETVRFCASCLRVTRSELVKEGFAKDKVDEIPAFDSDEMTQARRDRDELMDADDNPPDHSTEYVQRYECYVLIDHDGDGIAERRRIIAAGGTSKSISCRTRNGVTTSRSRTSCPTRVRIPGVAAASTTMPMTCRRSRRWAFAASSTTCIRSSISADRVSGLD